MTDDRPSTDGGETAAPMDIERAGDAPPDPPSDSGLERMLPDLLGEFEIDTTVYMVRAGLEDGSGRPVGERLVDAIEDKVTVVGTTLDAGFEPSNPELDVLIETDHDHGTIAAALARLGPVTGVVVADVTAAAERELAADDDDGDDAERDGGDANTVFNELKEEVGQEGYGEVVDELEDVEFPGGPDPDEEVDLEQEAGVDLSEPDPDEPIELDDDVDDGTLDLDDDVSTKDLLGEGERDTADVKGPDEKAIEEAIEDVDLADEPSDDGTGGDLDGRIPETPEPTEDGADAETEDDEPTADEEEATAPGGDAPAGSPAGGDMDAFVVQLIEALESGEVEGERLAELRKALGVQSTHNLDVRMEHVQKRVDNLAAYTDAWEAFLSEEGSGREFMSSVEEDIEAIERRLETVDAGDGTAGGDLAAIEQRLAEVESTLESIEDRHDEDVTRLDTRMDNVESQLASRIESVEDTVGALKEKVRSLLEWREHIDEVLGD
jgi:hypothetical protein